MISVLIKKKIKIKIHIVNKIENLKLKFV